MARRIFDTYHAPEDEIAEVKLALDQASISWFETVKGRWWVGSAGLWTSNDSDFERAREVVDRFQIGWRDRAVQANKENPTPGIRWTRVPILLVTIGLILYFTLFWFWI